MFYACNENFGVMCFYLEEECTSELKLIGIEVLCSLAYFLACTNMFCVPFGNRNALFNSVTCLLERVIICVPI